MNASRTRAWVALLLSACTVEQDLGGERAPAPEPNAEGETRLLLPAIDAAVQSDVDWAFQLESSDSVSPEVILFRPPDELVVLGWFTGSLRIGQNEVVSRGEEDMFAASFDTSGQPVAVRQYGGTGSDLLRSGAFVNGRLLAVGATQGGDIADDVLLPEVTGSLGIIAEIDESLEAHFVETAGAGDTVTLSNIAFDSAGQYAVTGSAAAHEIDATHASANAGTSFIAQFAANDSLQAVTTMTRYVGEQWIGSVYGGQQLFCAGLLPGPSDVSYSFGNAKGSVTVDAPRGAALVSSLYPNGAPSWHTEFGPTGAIPAGGEVLMGFTVSRQNEPAREQLFVAARVGASAFLPDVGAVAKEGGDGILVASMNASSRNWLWSKRIDDAGDTVALASDDTETLLVGSAPNAVVMSQGALATSSLYWAELSPAGTLKLAGTMGDEGAARHLALARLPDGSAVAVGAFSAPIELRPFRFKPAGKQSGFILKFTMTDTVVP